MNRVKKNFILSLSLSGGFMPCRHLRPSSGREYSRITYSVRRKPTTGTRCPTLFDKWHGIFYIPSRTDMAGHIKSFD